MPVKRILGLCGIILALLLCAYVLSGIRAALIPVTPATANSAKTTTPPPFTPAVQAQLAASKGFQVLVSYTDRGFESPDVTIHKGDTIRFTNNSSEDLWVASAGIPGTTNTYPAGAGSQCGQSAFDSCNVIGRGEFWEFTFDVVGTWGYQNNRDTKMTGVVHVK